MINPLWCHRKSRSFRSRVLSACNDRAQGYSIIGLEGTEPDLVMSLWGHVSVNFDPFKAFSGSFCCFLDLYSSYLAVMTFLYSLLPFILRLRNFCPSEKPRRSVLACFSSVYRVKATSTERSDARPTKEALTHTSIENFTPRHN